MNKLILIILLIIFSGCTDTFERLKRIGKAPELEDVKIAPEPIIEDMSSSYSDHISRAYKQRIKATNSLWLPGSTTFFSAKTWHIGDILKVVVLIKDSASLNNSTKHARSGKDFTAIPSILGLEKGINKLLSKKGSPNSLLDIKSQMDHLGSGNISRKEDIKTEIAAIVKQILPNGNLIIQGNQQVRVNHELRIVSIMGIVCPKYIKADNSINSDQIAEARISYGGKGVVSDVQQPRVGSQVLDIISPF